MLNDFSFFVQGRFPADFSASLSGLDIRCVESADFSLSALSKTCFVFISQSPAASGMERQFQVTLF